MADFRGIDAKIGRAKTHIANLKQAITDASDPKLSRFPLEYDPKLGKHVMGVNGVPPIDPEWPLVVGEILYNLRSALDHLAWQLVLFDGKKPYDKTQFPIREAPFDRRVKGKRIPTQLRPPVSNPQILEALEKVQPYSGVNGEGGDFRHSPLWRLNRLRNIDNHRLLLVVTAVLDVGEMWWGWGGDHPSPDVAINPQPVKEGTPVAWFDFHGHEPPDDFDPHPALAITLLEREMLDVSRVPICNLLDTLRWEVEERIIGWKFRPILEGRTPLL